jgi:hypothetical protein
VEQVWQSSEPMSVRFQTYDCAISHKEII